MTNRPVALIESVNNKIIVEPYKKTEMKSEVKNGFASIAQKNHLKGLKVLVNTELASGLSINAGDTVYVREETLHTAQWATKTFESDAVEGPFMIMDTAHIEMVSE